MTNIANSLQVVKSLVQLHRDDPVVVGMTPGTYSTHVEYVRKNTQMEILICMLEFLFLFFSSIDLS